MQKNIRYKSYKMHKYQKWFSAKIFDFVNIDVWPPKSPDLNPMDYFVLDAGERDTERTPGKADLISWIKVALTSISKEVVEVYARFRGRIEDIIDTNKGGLIE